MHVITEPRHTLTHNYVIVYNVNGLHTHAHCHYQNCSVGEPYTQAAADASRSTWRTMTRYSQRMTTGMMPRPNARRQTVPRRFGCESCLPVLWTSQMQSRMRSTATLTKLPQPCQSRERRVSDSP